MIPIYLVWCLLLEQVAASTAVELAHPAHLLELAMLLLLRLGAVFGAPILLSILLSRAMRERRGAARGRPRW